MTGSGGFDLVIVICFLFNVYIIYCMRKWKRLKKQALEKKPILKMEVELSEAFSNHDFERCRELIAEIEKESYYDKEIIKRIKIKLKERELNRN